MTTYGSEPVGMTDTGSTGTGTTDTGSTGSGGATGTAKEAASTAADQGKHVAGTAKEEARNVAGTAAEQARSVVGDAKQQVTSQLSDQATTQRDTLSQTLRTFGDDLQKMVEGQGSGQGMAADVAREVSDRVRSLGDHLQSREPSQLLDDARDFARRRPGMFLLGALAAGVVAGRAFRATADGAAAASLAESGGTTGTSYAGTGTGYSSGYDTGTSYDPGYGTGVGTGPMSTASGAAPLTDEPTSTQSSTRNPGTTGYDTPVADPTLTTPASTDSTSSGLPGQRTQDTP